MGINDIIGLIVGIVVLFIIGVFLFFKFAPKGYVGETIVRKTMDFTLPKDEYKVFNNVLLYYEGKSVQIDHIVASRYGIFVIETKNYSGTICGNENSKNFIQYVGRQRNAFYSPIKQNKSHIYALSKVIGNYPYKSLVVFLGEATLKVNSTTFVGTPLNASHYIRNFYDVVLSDGELEEFVSKLVSNNVRDSISNREHVENIYYNMEKYNTALESKICPWCGSKLVLRRGKYGLFYGCSSYPKCKFVYKEKH